MMAFRGASKSGVRSMVLIKLPRFARGEERQFTQIYFTMSTWNPYQVMLMTTTVRLGGTELPTE